MLTAFLLAAILQTAAPPPQSPPPPTEPAGAQAGRAWGDCVRGRIDARIGADATPDALVTEAFAQCAAQEQAIRAALAAAHGDEAARLNIERIRSGGRQLFLAYIERARARPADQPH